MAYCSSVPLCMFCGVLLWTYIMVWQNLDSQYNSKCIRRIILIILRVAVVIIKRVICFFIMHLLQERYTCMYPGEISNHLGYSILNKSLTVWFECWIKCDFLYVKQRKDHINTINTQNKQWISSVETVCVLLLVLTKKSV